MKEESFCPVCEHEDAFKRLFHHYVYLVGYLTMIEVDLQSPEGKFYKSILEGCRTFYNSQNKETKTS